jgi:hypothetical protein
MVSSNGAVCKGNFVYVTHRQGEGVFNCDDGRSAPFAFVSTGTSGTGQRDTRQSEVYFYVWELIESLDHPVTEGAGDYEGCCDVGSVLHVDLLDKSITFPTQELMLRRNCAAAFTL